MAEYPTLSKREMILDAAVKIFSSKGFHSAKIEDIAQEAGIGKGTVYEYFRSKEQLFTEILKEGIKTYNSLANQELEKEKTVSGKLVGLVKMDLKFGQRYRPLARITMLEAIPVNENFREWLHKMHLQRINIVKQIIDEGIERGELRSVNSSISARLLYGGIGLFSGPFAEREMSEDEIEMISGKIVEYYLKGIGR